MGKRERLEDAAIDRFVSTHPGWARDGGALSRTFEFARYGAGLGFAVQVGVVAEQRDHHPDLFVGYRKVRVAWSTHDAGGVTALDCELAAITDELFRG